MNINQYDTAEGHCQRSLAYSKRYGLEGEEKISKIFGSLRIYCELRQRQGNLSDAVTFAEEAYNLVVEAYDPVHPQVQEAAGLLINILIVKGDLFDAERYAQVTYGNLRDKKNGIDQDSELVAKGAYNLAYVILEQNGDLMKAEELARESLRIRTLKDNINIGCCLVLLARIMVVQGNLGDETRELHASSLACFIKNEGLDGINTANATINMGAFYRNVAEIQPTIVSKRIQLLLAQSYYEEGLRIKSKIHGPSHPSTVYISSKLAEIIRALL
jgi:tetratricopeptide (TPR) repeat protein